MFPDNTLAVESWNSVRGLLMPLLDSAAFSVLSNCTTLHTYNDAKSALIKRFGKDEEQLT